MQVRVLEHSAHLWPTGSTDREKNVRARTSFRARAKPLSGRLPGEAVGSTAEAAKPLRTDRPKWSRWRKLFAVIGALILVSVGVYVVYAYLNGLPPAVVASSGPGQALVDVALMTLYPPSLPGSTDFNVSASVVLGDGWHFPFAWENVSGTALPVRFVVAPSSVLAANGTSGFVFTDGVVGTTSWGTDRAAPATALVSRWTLDYSVQELSAWQGFRQVSWLEVDYRVTPTYLFIGAALPVANVSAPGPSDLLPTGVTDSLNLSVAPGYQWSIARDLATFAAPPSAFHHTLPAITFDAGSVGTITASLSSSFRWGKGDDYRVSVSGSGTMQGYLTWYWDARFGSLYSVFSS